MGTRTVFPGSCRARGTRSTARRSPPRSPSTCAAVAPRRERTPPAARRAPLRPGSSAALQHAPRPVTAPLGTARHRSAPLGTARHHPAASLTVQARDELVDALRVHVEGELLGNARHVAQHHEHHLRQLVHVAPLLQNRYGISSFYFYQEYKIQQVNQECEEIKYP